MSKIACIGIMAMHLSLILQHAGYFKVDQVLDKVSKSIQHSDKPLHGAASETPYKHGAKAHDDLQEREPERQRYRHKRRNNK